MLPELAVIGLILAFLVSLLRIRQPSRLLAGIEFVLLILAMLVLIVLRVQSDFSVLNVAEHSNSGLPLLYKITGAWGNHEGSLLLWACLQSLMSLLLTLQTYRYRNTMLAAHLTAAARVHATTVAGFLALLFTAHPFQRIFPSPSDGADLNPILQDVALSMHPPTLYAGYVGFSVVFALAVSALLRRELPIKFGVILRPWILISWGVLTLGIGLGSWWAYRELGWGGYWFWDPVENASLLPWLTATALLHSLAVWQKRRLLGEWVVLLAILTFAMSMIGMFLVRSGVITSVHGFAADPTRGLAILAYFLCVVGTAIVLFTMRAKAFKSDETLLPVSREGALVFNNLFFITAMLTVLLGTIYPLITQWFNQPVAVGAPYYHATFIPLACGAILLAIVAPYVSWQKDAWRRVVKQLAVPGMAVLAAWLVILAIADRHILTALLGGGLGVGLAASALHIWFRQKRSRRSRTALGMGHLGAALLMLGVTAMAAGKVEKSALLNVGEEIAVGPYRAQLVESAGVKRSNHLSVVSTVQLNDIDGQRTAQLYPEYRFYNTSRNVTSEAAILPRLWGDIYVVTGDNPTREGTQLRFYLNPLSHLLWIGCIVMALAGLLAAFPTSHSKPEEPA